MTNDKKPNKLAKNKDIDLLSQKTDNDSISVRHVREDVKNAIEQMGTNRNDTETDDDTTFNESIVQIEIKEITTNCGKAMFDSSQDISQMTAYDISEIVECACPIIKPYQNEQKYTSLSIIDDSYPSTYKVNEKCSNESNLVKHEMPVERPSRLGNWLRIKNRKESSCKCNKNCELYTINIEQPPDDHSPPRRLVFDLLDELPKPDTKTVATNTKKSTTNNAATGIQIKKSQGIHDHVVTNPKGVDVSQRIDIYYFDHGNSEYYRTTDAPPAIMTELLAERTEQYTKKFWAQMFGTVQIGVSFVVSFILQFLRFLLQAIVRPLTIGLIQIISDYFIKPCFAIMFNGLIQPVLIFLYNVAISARDVCHPIAMTIGFFIREFAVLLKSCRLIHMERTTRTCKVDEIKECS